MPVRVGGLAMAGERIGQGELGFRGLDRTRPERSHAGVERLLIEFIRVNTTYELFGVAVTQAQLISVACIVAGAIGMIFLSRTKKGTDLFIDDKKIVDK